MIIGNDDSKRPSSTFEGIDLIVWNYFFEVMDVYEHNLDELPPEFRKRLHDRAKGLLAKLDAFENRVK